MHQHKKAFLIKDRPSPDCLCKTQIFRQNVVRKFDSTIHLTLEVNHWLEKQISQLPISRSGAVKLLSVL